MSLIRSGDRKEKQRGSIPRRSAETIVPRVKRDAASERAKHKILKTELATTEGHD